jgi:hypothetical protein
MSDPLIVSGGGRNFTGSASLERPMDERDPAKRSKAPDMSVEHEKPIVPGGTADVTLATVHVDVQRLIGDHLRAVYDEVVKEPVPERFVKLLEELERKRAARP